MIPLSPMIKKDFCFIAGCCFLFFVLSCMQWCFEPVISRDGILYLELAETWYKSGSFFTETDRWSSLWIPPFYIWLIKLGYGLGLPAELVGRSISMACGVVLPWIVYLISEEIREDKRVSYVAAALMAVSPSMIEFSIEIQRDIFYLAFTGWSFYFSLRGLLRKEIWPWLPAGFCFCCAVLTRFEAMELPPILFFAFLLSGFKKYESWKRLILQGTALFCACMISFFSLIYIMGIEKYMWDSYSKYFVQKCKYMQSLYLKK